MGKTIQDILRGGNIVSLAPFEKTISVHNKNGTEIENIELTIPDLDEMIESGNMIFVKSSIIAGDIIVDFYLPQ